MTAPLLSFIVLSYNYQDYIGTTLRSILGQTVGDFEVIVVDDASTDQSRGVVRGFADPRIRLLVNERNLGGAASYNIAVNAARGEWLVNLDSDDWIAPEKSAAQLAVVAADPRLDIVGTWIQVIGTDGARHPAAETVEAQFNRDHDLNRVETWIGQNPLCRSSTMVRRSAHLAIGLDDPAMVRAPDYELWTRALAAGLRFGLVREPLTFYRLHPRGVTQGDPAATLRELGYAMARNLAPLAERQAAFELHDRMLRWVATHPLLDLLPGAEGPRLVGTLLSLPALPDFAAFRAGLAAQDANVALERAGRMVILGARGSVPAGMVDKLNADILAYQEARDYWRARHDNVAKQQAEIQAHQEAGDYWKRQSESWRSVVQGPGTGAEVVSRTQALRIAARMLRRALRPWSRSS